MIKPLGTVHLYFIMILLLNIQTLEGVNGGSSVGVVNRKDAYYDGQNDLVLTIPDIGSGWERNDIEDHINEARGVVFDAKVIIRIIYITRTI